MSASSWRWPTSSSTTGRRSDSWSTGRIPPRGSGSPTSRPASPVPSMDHSWWTAGWRAFRGAVPARESFREAKYRVQNRLVNELDPKLDLSNQAEVRRQIEELFGKVADEGGMAPTRP